MCGGTCRVVFSPKRMVMVPPRHYCVVLNPVARGPTGAVLFDGAGQAQLRHADLDIRLTQEPFPLYPGEELQQVRIAIHSAPVAPYNLSYPFPDTLQILPAPLPMGFRVPVAPCSPLWELSTASYSFFNV